MYTHIMFTVIIITIIIITPARGPQEGSRTMVSHAESRRVCQHMLSNDVHICMCIYIYIYIYREREREKNVVLFCDFVSRRAKSLRVVETLRGWRNAVGNLVEMLWLKKHITGLDSPVNA